MDNIPYAVALLILGILALCMFRAPIIRKIDALSSAGKDGAKFTIPQQTQATTDSELKAYDDVMGTPVSLTAQQRERELAEQITGMAGMDTERKARLLMRLLGSASATIEFYQVGIYIFGSQVSLLVKLVQSSAPLPTDVARAIFDEAKLQFSDIHAQRSLDEWLEFLQSRHLIQKNGDFIDIAQAGKDFLKFMVDARIAYNRNG
jgi:hypothetical protein